MHQSHYIPFNTALSTILQKFICIRNPIIVPIHKFVLHLSEIFMVLSFTFIAIVIIVRIHIFIVSLIVI